MKKRKLRNAFFVIVRQLGVLVEEFLGISLYIKDAIVGWLIKHEAVVQAPGQTS